MKSKTTTATYSQVIPAAIPVYYPAPTTPLTREEMEEVFGRIGRHDALWQALSQLLQERLAQAVVDASQGESHAPGRLQELLAMQQTFAAWRRGKTGKSV